MVRLTDRPDMTLDVYRGRKTTMRQQQQQLKKNYGFRLNCFSPLATGSHTNHMFLSCLLSLVSSFCKAFSQYVR